MRKFILVFILFCVCGLLASAQNASNNKKQKLSTGNHSQLCIIPLSGEVGLNTEPGWNVVFTNIPDKVEEDEKAGKIKESYPTKHKESNSSFRTEQSGQTSTAAVQKGHQFDTNIFDGSYPPDNTAAVSKAGFIVSVINSNIAIYDTSANNFLTESIISFVNDTSLKDLIYDPEIIYDPAADRFILVEAEGISSSTADILLFASKTNNPLQGWNYYKIPVTKNTPGDYADYPKVAVSDSNIYVTTNLISGTGNFDQSVIYQVDKISVYSGGTLNYMFWNGIHDGSNTPFTLIPAPSAATSNYGNGMYFTSVSDGSGASEIQVFQITGDLSNSPQLISSHVDVGQFQIGSDAIQPGNGSPQLDVGDCRIKSAFYLSNIIHCVFTLVIDNSGYNGFMYARINTVDNSVATQTFGLGDVDIAYPSMSSIGFNEYDKSVVIFYDESGKNTFPGTAAIVCDDVMNFNSPISVKEGAAPIKIDQRQIERWGDYSSTCLMDNNGVPTAWGFGIYGTTDSVYGNNLCELRNISKPDTTLGNSNVKVYPNPFTNNCTIKIENKDETDASFDLYDAAGRLIKHLAEEHLLAGEYTFGFSRELLSAGVYQLVISSGKKIIIHAEIVVQ